MAEITRRTFLKAGAAAAASLAFPSIAFGEWKNVTKVVLVCFGGGVRYSETFGDPLAANLPGIKKNILPSGTLFTNLYNEGSADHVGGILQILTGKKSAITDIDDKTPKFPTFFECYRQAKGNKRIPDWKTIIINHTTLDFSFASSNHADFGSSCAGLVFAPRLLMYDHLLKVMTAEEDTTSDIYRTAKELREKIWVDEDFEHVEDPDRTPPQYAGDAQNYVRSVLEKAKVPSLRPEALGDELVWYFAETAMTTIKPDILVINFGGPDIAHRGSFSDYVSKIQCLDDLVVRVFNETRKNKAYQNCTLFIVTPDCGRSLPGLGSGGFTSHSSGDDGCRRLWAVVAGPGTAKKSVVSTSFTQYDIAPTIGEALGFPVPHADGKPLPS